MFFYPFLEAKNGRKVEPQRIPKSIKNRCRNHCFFDPFLGAFWYLLTPLSEGHGGPPEGNLHGHVFGHTVRPHLVARCLEVQLEFRFAFKFGSFC